MRSHFINNHILLKRPTAVFKFIILIIYITLANTTCKVPEYDGRSPKHVAVITIQYYAYNMCICWCNNKY
jgi:hypothetical protein